jgi:riboflavin synthase
MFTGLIESVGEVTAVTPIQSGFRIRVASDVSPELRLGESVAVNGVCLTVVDVEPSERYFAAEVGPETARVTSLGALRSGSLVNLERAMAANGRFGGHLVLGHVDGTGTVTSIRPEADFRWLSVSFPSELAPYFIHRGSVAIDGISLTIATLETASLVAQIVPFTWTHTNLRTIAAGTRVNLECDMVGKYVVRMLELQDLPR